MKLALITNMIPPYRDILFSEIRKNKNVKDFCVYSFNKNEPNRKWVEDTKKDYQIIKTRGLSIIIGNKLNPIRIIHFYPKLILKVINKRPDFIILGDISITQYICLFVFHVFRIKTILWHEDSRKLYELNKISRFIKSFLYKIPIKYITPSISSKMQLIDMGIKDYKIAVIANPINNDKFKNLYKKNIIKKSELRNSYGISQNDLCFTFVGQLISRKRILETAKLVRDFSQVSNKKIYFVICGNGDLLEELKNFIFYNSEIKYIIFNNLNEEELSKIYTISDTLLLLSNNEPWGMVINEAMIHNLPIISTKEVEASNYYIDKYEGLTVAKFENINNSLIKNHLDKFINQKKCFVDPLDAKSIANQIINFIKG